MSRLLLDTSAYSAMRRGDQRLLGPAREASAVYLTPVVVGELLYGFVGGGLARQNRALLREFLDSERVEVLNIDGDTAERYAVIRDQLRRQGTPIPTNDLWIAACAKAADATLLTTDRDFAHLSPALLDVEVVSS
jgi:tRNA(fMet)-specific endonuclease VapC